MIDKRSTGLNCLVAHSDALGSAAPLEMEQVNVLMCLLNMHAHVAITLGPHFTCYECKVNNP